MPKKEDYKPSGEWVWVNGNTSRAIKDDRAADAEQCRIIQAWLEMTPSQREERRKAARTRQAFALPHKYVIGNRLRPLPNGRPLNKGKKR